MELLQHGLNIPLPDEFPRRQLIDICAALTRLPNGTAEGCRAPLEYARNRLPNIRRAHIATEGAAREETALTRGTPLDRKLSSLVTSVSTAWDEYRRLAAEETEPEFKPEAGVAASKATVSDALAQANELADKLGQAQATISEIAQPHSAGADDLKRQLQDARGLSQLASAEVRMPRVVPGWLRKTVAALKKCPDIIRRTMARLKTGVDIAEVFANRWHEFQHEGIQFILEQIRKTANAGYKVADILDCKNGSVGTTPPEPETDANEATAAMHAVRRREALQSSVRESLIKLEQADKVLNQVVLEFNNAYDEASEQRVVHRQKFLAGMKELANIERFLAMHRQYTVAAGSDLPAAGAIVEPTLGLLGMGYTQRVFEQLIQMVLTEAGLPMQAGEVLDALAERGLPVGGMNPTKTVWNRLSDAKANGILEHIDNVGYWLKGVSLPPGASDEALRRRRIKRKSKRYPPARNTGNAPGRQHYLSDAEIQLARGWFRSGKSLSEVCANLGGITPRGLLNYFPGGIKALREQYPHLAKQPILAKQPANAARKTPLRSETRTKRPGRRPTLDDAQVAEVKDLHASGMSVPVIATQMGVGIAVIYRALGGIRRRKTQPPSGSAPT